MARISAGAATRVGRLPELDVVASCGEGAALTLDSIAFAADAVEQRVANMSCPPSPPGRTRTAKQCRLRAAPEWKLSMDNCIRNKIWSCCATAVGSARSLARAAGSHSPVAPAARTHLEVRRLAASEVDFNALTFMAACFAALPIMAAFFTAALIATDLAFRAWR